MKQTNRGRILFRLTVILYLVFSLFWLYANIFENGDSSALHGFFSDTYGVFALWGFVLGLNISRKWGGVKSVLGKSLFCLSLGMFCQFFGQVTYSLYALIFKIEVPYPSLGDLGFFGSIPFYIYGTFLLGKALNISFGFSNIMRKFYVLLIPFTLLLVSYFLFLGGYTFDWAKPLVILLDFGYPFGQTLYVSLALIIFVLSNKVLGGLMRPKVLFLFIALVIQYLADYTFLYQSYRGTWIPGSWNDLMYLTSYFVMTMSLIQFMTALSELRDNKYKSVENHELVSTG